jgi:hypothetical protein
VISFELRVLAAQVPFVIGSLGSAGPDAGFSVKQPLLSKSGLP